jgi:hypothetical protein
MENVGERTKPYIEFERRQWKFFAIQMRMDALKNEMIIRKTNKKVLL